MTEQHEKEEHEDLAGKAGETTGSEAGEDREEIEEEEEEEEAENEDSGKSSKSQMKIWIAIAIGVVVALLLVFKPGGNAQSGPATVGSTINGDLTLVTADRNELECAAANGTQGYQCGFIDDKQSRTLDEKVKLRPFMTVDRQLFLIPGLFLESAIQQRFNTEPPTKPRAELKRFTAKCKIKVVGELDAVKLRWQPEGAWEAPKKFPVATISDCVIEG